jgi:hypothetical protein
MNSIVPAVSRPISPLIYGVNFPPSASYISDLGVTLSRWGGNAVTAYNPNGGFTNAGMDWFFENRVASPPDADAWNGWVGGAGSGSLLTIPAYENLSLLSNVLSRLWPMQSRLGRQGRDIVLVPHIEVSW